MEYWEVEEKEHNVVKVSIKEKYSKANIYCTDTQVLYFYRYGLLGLIPLSSMKSKLQLNPSDFFTWFFRRESIENIYLNPVKTDYENKIVQYPTDAIIQTNLFKGIYFSYRNDKAKQQLFKCLDKAFENQVKELKKTGYKLYTIQDL